MLDNAILNLANDMLFAVALICAPKIDNILARDYSQPFLDWYQKFNESSNLGDPGVAPGKVEQIANYLEELHVALQDPKIEGARGPCIVAAEGLHPHLNELEPLWIRFATDKSSGETVVVEGDDGEEDEDRQSLTDEELRKSRIYRLVKKLAHYSIACHNVVRSVMNLSRPGGPSWDFKIETVPLDAANVTCSPQQLNEYSDAEKFFGERLKEETTALNGKLGISSLRDSWPSKWKTKNLFLHAEMQLALYYAFNPHITPLHGYIGVSQKCCFSCDLVLKCVLS